MAIYNITLTGPEMSIGGVSEKNAHIRNDGTSAVYASKKAGIRAGDNGVLCVPAGAADIVADAAAA